MSTLLIALQLLTVPAGLPEPSFTEAADERAARGDAGPEPIRLVVIGSIAAGVITTVAIHVAAAVSGVLAFFGITVVSNAVIASVVALLMILMLVVSVEIFLALFQLLLALVGYWDMNFSFV